MRIQRHFSTLALRIDELILRPANMEFARQLAMECLADALDGQIENLQFPVNSNDPNAWTPTSLVRERGEEPNPVLKLRQIALILAAVHDVYFPNVQTIVLLPEATLTSADEGDATARYIRIVRWKTITDTVRKLGADARPWLVLLLRRFSFALPEHVPEGTAYDVPVLSSVSSPADLTTQLTNEATVPQKPLASLGPRRTPGAGGAPNEATVPQKPLASLLSAKELAAALRVSNKENAVNQALSRIADTSPGCRVEIPDHRRGEAQYLYRVAAVWDTLLSKLPRWRDVRATND